MNDEILSLVRYELNQEPWRVTEIYVKAVKIDSRIERKGLEWFKHHYVNPLLNGKEDIEKRAKKIDVPHRAFRNRVKRRMEKMKDRDELQKEKLKCPADGCDYEGVEQGLKVHIGRSHSENKAEILEKAGLELVGNGSSSRREPILLSPEKQEKVLEILERGASTSEYTLPEREEVRSAFLSFAREVRDTADALEVAASLDTFVDLMYELFTKESDDESTK